VAAQVLWCQWRRINWKKCWRKRSWLSVGITVPLPWRNWRQHDKYQWR